MPFHAANVLTYVQFAFAVIIGLYFWNLLRSQQTSKVAVERESVKETEKLRKLRDVSLTQPLAEVTRPQGFEDIVGQTQALTALRAALCGRNPQHVLVYGPPGVGKTAAARLILEEAKRNADSPFGADSKFVELDANTARFDERGIADPLIGSVHDPIYQGAGPLGIAGVPQPKPGAVTKAHGGILFIDEIGELHSIQINKLLKILEDRKVFLESAYYSPEDVNVPRHIHDMFQNGLPADFRLVGATTRMPEDIPPAIRSRCLEIFFSRLTPQEIGIIAKNAADKLGLELDHAACAVVKKYASSGREAVNIIQLAGGMVTNKRSQRIISVPEIEWVVASGQHSPRPEQTITGEPQVGVINGLAILGPNYATLLEIEVATLPAEPGRGRITVTGIIEEEEMGGRGRTLRRKSMALGSVENVLTVLRSTTRCNPRDYDIHVNFPGGLPVDGPSAGLAMALAIHSSLTHRRIDNRVAVTGELSIRGTVKAVGGVVAKINAAREAGAHRVLVPQDNWQAMFASEMGIEICPIEHIEQAVEMMFVPQE